MVRRIFTSWAAVAYFSVLHNLTPYTNVRAWTPTTATTHSSDKTSRRDLLIAVPSHLIAVSTLFSVPSVSKAEDQKKRLTFETIEDGVKFADISIGSNSEQTVQPDSKVTFHVVGRLLGKQGWVFLNTQAEPPENDPYRLQLGKGKIIKGLEQGMVGMRVGGTRRIVIPSAVGYVDKSLEPVPRDFGNQQRLYTTVMNNVRKDREREALGEDLAGVIVMDVKLMRIRQ